MLSLKKNKYPGRLIVFEGTDGAGKSTLIHMTRQYLSALYGEERIMLEKQPTDLSRKTRLFRKMMYSEHKDNISYRAVQLLTLSDRIQHNHEVIVPALQDGKIVLCDRYIYTSISNMLARGYTHEKWFFQACKEIVKPDLSILAYISPQKAIERIKGRPEESERYLDEALLKRVAKNFVRYHKPWGLNLIETEMCPETTFEKVKGLLKILEKNENANR